MSDVLSLMAGLLLLLGSLFVAAYLARPPSVAWYMRRFTRRLNVLAQTIGERLTPAFEDATVAIGGLAAVLDDPEIRAALNGEPE